VAVAPAPVIAAPPPATPPPVQKPAVDDEAAVRQVVARLKQAIEQKDLSLYKKLRPDLKPDEERRLRDAFQNVTSQQVDYSVDSVSVEGDRATLRVTRSGRVSGQAVPAVRQVLKLSRTESGWVITEIGQ
jgi:DNA-binding transcriptional regulator YdaS (Cro superfamily)